MKNDERFPCFIRSINRFVCIYHLSWCTLCSLIMVPHGQAGVPFASVCHYRMGGMTLPTPTAEWSASLEQPCRKAMVTPLLLLSSEDNLMMNCVPVCLSMCMIRSSTGSCGVGVLTLEARDAYPVLQVYSGSVSCRMRFRYLYIYIYMKELKF